MPPMKHPDLLEGFDHFSDAGVFRLRDDLAIVQTVDFFPPIVDDPVEYGRIAAANSLSDIYAMGARPITALSIVGFPRGKLDMSVLGQILAGGAEKVLEAGAVILGGHSVSDSEVKFGLSVTGVVHPERFVRNSGARPGDVLVLTKPLGTGTITTALKQGKAPAEALRAAVRSMSTLNRDASEAMLGAGVHGATDVTGFGLLGHGREMAEASGVTLSIEASRLPVLPGALDLAGQKISSGGAGRNRAFLEDKVAFGAGVPAALTSMLFEAETSGGLLAALPEEGARRMVAELESKGHHAVRIGRVLPRGERAVVVCAG